MTEIEVTNGKNIIQYIYDSLIIKNVVNAFSWAGSGTISAYYSVSDYSESEKTKLTNELNQTLINGNDSSIIDSIKTFLNLFSNGVYSVSYSNEKISPDEQLLKESINRGNQNSFREKIFYGWAYLGYDCENYFIYTLQNQNLNEDRIQYYIELISNGKKPKVLTIGNYDVRYILDGHHKLEAYIRLDKEVPMYNIKKLSVEENELEKSLEFAYKYIDRDEFNDMFFGNGLLSRIDYLKFPEFTKLIDEYISNEKPIGKNFNHNFGELFIRMYNSENEAERLWFSERLEKIKNANYFGLGLPYFIMENNIGHWKRFPIILKSDFDEWLNKIKK